MLCQIKWLTCILYIHKVNVYVCFVGMMIDTFSHIPHQITPLSLTPPNPSPPPPNPRAGTQHSTAAHQASKKICISK